VDWPRGKKPSAWALTASTAARELASLVASNRIEPVGGFSQAALSKNLARGAGNVDKVEGTAEEGGLQTLQAMRVWVPISEGVFFYQARNFSI